jgi:hypothetical protein
MARTCVDARQPWLERRFGGSAEVECAQKLKKKWWWREE